MFLLFLTYLHLILYKNNSSVSRDFLPRHVNRHSKQSIYETNIFNIFNDFKKFLTIFNSSVDYNFVFSHSFKFYANFDDNLVIPECILTLYTELITVLFKLRNVFFDNFDYQKLWKTIALMVCFNSFIFSRQIYRIFIVSISSLIWLKKIPVLLFISSLLILIDSFKKFWRFVKRNLLKIVIARSPGYFIVLMLISYNHFYVTNCTNTLCSVDVSVSVNSNINGPSINIFDKNFNFSFYNSSRLCYDVRKYQKINLLAPKGSRNSDNMNILSFFFIFLLSFNLLRKRKNDPCLKIILTSIAFLVCILHRFSKSHNRLKSCFTCQFFTHDTIEITNEVNTSHFQSELSIFTISKFRFKNDNSFCVLLLLLSGDISLNPGNPQLFKQEQWQACSNR